MKLENIKHDLLKNLYTLENSFDITDLDDCQNFLLLLSKLMKDEDLDPDISLSIDKIFEKGKLDYYQYLQNLKENLSNPKENNIRPDDNDRTLDYNEHSNTFQTLFSYRLFCMNNPDANYNNRF